MIRFFESAANSLLSRPVEFWSVLLSMLPVLMGTIAITGLTYLAFAALGGELIASMLSVLVAGVAVGTGIHYAIGCW